MQLDTEEKYDRNHSAVSFWCSLTHWKLSSI